MRRNFYPTKCQPIKIPHKPLQSEKTWRIFGFLYIPKLTFTCSCPKKRNSTLHIRTKEAIDIYTFHIVQLLHWMASLLSEVGKLRKSMALSSNWTQSLLISGMVKHTDLWFKDRNGWMVYWISGKENTHTVVSWLTTMNLPQEKLSSSITFEEERNVFVKPNEQNRACSSYAMARKRRMKSNVSSMIWTMVSDGTDCPNPSWQRTQCPFFLQHLSVTSTRPLSKDLTWRGSDSMQQAA